MSKYTADFGHGFKQSTFDTYTASLQLALALDFRFRVSAFWFGATAACRDGSPLASVSFVSSRISATSASRVLMFKSLPTLLLYAQTGRVQRTVSKMVGIWISSTWDVC